MSHLRPGSVKQVNRHPISRANRRRRPAPPAVGVHIYDRPEQTYSSTTNPRELLVLLMAISGLVYFLVQRVL